jgi:hypothetical protein
LNSAQITFVRSEPGLGWKRIIPTLDQSFIGLWFARPFSEIFSPKQDSQRLQNRSNKKAPMRNSPGPLLIFCR